MEVRYAGGRKESKRKFGPWGRWGCGRGQRGTGARERVEEADARGEARGQGDSQSEGEAAGSGAGGDAGEALLVADGTFVSGLGSAVYPVSFFRSGFPPGIQNISFIEGILEFFEKLIFIK